MTSPIVYHTLFQRQDDIRPTLFLAEAAAALHDELFRALLDELMTGRLSALALVEAEPAL
jgi:hypothetical protein